MDWMPSPGIYHGFNSTSITFEIDNRALYPGTVSHYYKGSTMTNHQNVHNKLYIANIYNIYIYIYIYRSETAIFINKDGFGY